MYCCLLNRCTSLSFLQYASQCTLLVHIWTDVKFVCRCDKLGGKILVYEHISNNSMTSNAVTSSQAVICWKMEWIYGFSKTVTAT